MQPDQPGWWKRNWKWAVPSGCLMVVILLFGGCVALMTAAVGAMKSSGAYEQAIDRLKEHPGAIAVLGEPITASWMISGNFHEGGGKGTADYSVPVSGPRGGGKLYVEARKSAGRWTFEVLTLVPDGDAEPIDLRDDAERRAAPHADPGPLEIEDDPTRKSTRT
jgi:hypothetical protein